MTTIACPYCGAKSGQPCAGYGLANGDVHEARRGGATKASDVTELGRARALLGCSSSMSLIDGVRKVTSLLTEQSAEMERIRSQRTELLAACMMILRDLDYGSTKVVDQTIHAIEVAVKKAKEDS